MAVPRAEKAYEKYAWILLFALGVATLFFAFGALSSGKFGGPFPDAAEFGFPLIGYGFFILAVSRVSYRRGERWAWFVSWYLPVNYALFVIDDLIQGGSRAQFAVVPTLFLAVSLAGLLLPYRKFFPRKQP